MTFVTSLEEVTVGYKEIPVKYVYTCDHCGHCEEKKLKTERPMGWALVKFIQGAEDFQGVEVADASYTRLLCRKCRYKANEVWKEMKNAKKAKK
jgi:hypothetical protein